LQAAPGAPVPTRFQLARATPDAPARRELFEVALKRMYRAEHVGHVWRHVVPALEHPNDGLIFTDVELKYECGECQGILKWKPLHQNSVDFALMACVSRETPGLQHTFGIAHQRRGTIRKYNRITLDAATKAMVDRGELVTVRDGDTSANGAVIECVWDLAWKTVVSDGNGGAKELPGGWRFERTRVDKKLPNAEKTVQRVKESIADNITIEELQDRLGDEGA
jgi:hypothetical protein